MRTIRMKLAASAATLALVACAEYSASGSGGFERDYFAARTALESGKYEKAVKKYDSMLQEAGPLQTRLRLEKAHALLRADMYPQAAQEAAFVASAHTDNRRAAALAVVGTAEHRMAQEAMSNGDMGPQTIAHLNRSKAALSEMLAKSPDMDPVGSMAQRLEMVQLSLKQLGG